MTATIKQKDGKYFLTLDGKEVENVKSITLSMNQGELPVLTLSVYVESAEVEAQNG